MDRVWEGKVRREMRTRRYRNRVEGGKEADSVLLSR